ncbi:YaaR family protein [Paenibacillus senegalensis]|uniref:YaaR family protein n=1 Tax=Paenibacillus senegalensis TaxID=1465766 RepID=UPI000288BF55|nr:YaaR family protein [Paenibacillus senegalensis]
MKIIPGMRPFSNDIKLIDNSSSTHVHQKTFSELMQHHDQRATSNELQKILDQIHRQGERLSKSLTIRELNQYKQLVKKYLEETARRGVRLRESAGWDRRGRGRKYKILEEIDSVLLSMADELLEQENGRIELLNKIGEIRGMLINLLY